MSQTKAQLVTPLAAAGVVTATSMTVSGVLTATTYDGNITGAAVSIAQGNNLNVGVLTASGISGDITGSATSITQGNNVTFGSLTASRLVGNLTGNAVGNALGDALSATVTGVTTSNNISVGVVTATNFLGDGTNLTGTLGNQVTPQTQETTYSIDVTSPAGGNYTLSGTDRNGAVSGSDPTVTVEIGDTLNFVVDASGHPFYIRVSDGGANVSTPAATNQGSQSGTVSWTPNTAGTYYYQCGNHAGMIGTITVSATTTIDLSEGNLITFNQTANTTVSFANTSNGYVYIIRKKDISDTARTITWPTGIGWSGGSEPTLDTDGKSVDIIKLVTRDEGVTWDARLVYNDNASALTAYVWGGNNDGIQGRNMDEGSWPGYNGQLSSPTQIASLWKDVSTNKRLAEYAGGVRNDGTLWTWGSNDKGKLGLNQSSPTKLSSPTQVGTESTWSEIHPGDKHALGLKNDGTLWSMGGNQKGQLGLNNTAQYSSPTQIPGTWSGSNIVSGSYFSAAVKSDNTLWVWGRNYEGQLGQNQQGVDYSSPVQITGTTWSYCTHPEYQFALATKTDGTLWAWGHNTAWAMGINQPTTTYRSSPVQIPGTWATGRQQICGAEKSSAGIKADGTLWTWGMNQEGQLGQNTPVNTYQSSPVQVGTDTDWLKVDIGGYGPSGQATLALKTDGTLWAWGTNAVDTNGIVGQLGQNVPNQANQHRSSPVQIGTQTNWTKIHAAGTQIALTS